MTDAATLDSLRHELDLARARITELEGKLAESAQRERELSAIQTEAQHMKAWFDDLVSTVPGLIWESWGDAVDNRVDFISDHIETMVGYSRREWLAMPGRWFKIVHPDDRERVQRELAVLMAGKGGSMQSRWIARDGRVLWVDIRFVVIRDPQGRAIGRRGITLDITALKEAEEERVKLQDALIEAQAAALVELSTPLIPISDRAMVMPLVGVLDEVRAEKMLERLLHGMASSRALVAIVDVTGVPELDRGVADVLVQAARGVQLIGAQVVLTGIRPEVAHSLVELQIDLGGITTRSTLESGIAYAMERR
jgi:rsbT co-antagonist protein RsbR